MSTVLLVDDDAQFRQLVSGALTSRGHTVIEAPTGRDGTLAVKKHQPNIVIVDGLLPDGDGLKWIPKLREASNTEVPIVFVSSFYRDMSSFKRLNDELRVALIAHKPLEPVTFVTQIDALLGNAPLQLIDDDFISEIVEAPAAPPPGQAPAKAEVSPADELRIHLEQMRQAYSAQLPKFVSELRTALEKSQLAPHDMVKWDDARTRAHKIRGTAGSHGLMDASNAAATIEDALLALKGLAPPLAQPFWQKASAALKALPQTPAPPPIPVAVAPSRTMPSEIVFAYTPNLQLVRELTLHGRGHGYAVVQVKETNELVERARVRVPGAVLFDMQDRSPEIMQRTMAAMRTIPGTENTTIALLEGASGPVPEALAMHAGASLRLPVGTAVDVVAASVGRLLASRPQQTRVLVVDDDQTFGQLVLDVLGPRGIAARHLVDPSKIFDTLEEVNPDLVLLDMLMPQAHGLDVCRQIRANGKWRHLSVLFLTAQSDVEQRIAAFRAGADDYLVKPVVNEELLARVEVRVERAKLMRDRADRDALTGLALRRAFIEQLEARLGESRRYKRPLSLALIDLDHFKKINDTYGHLVGDRVLANMGQLLSTRLRTEDLRGRWGGEELVLALPNTPAPMARQVLTRLLDELMNTPFRTDDNRTFQVSFSAGVSAFVEDGDSAEALLRVADTRLYAAKQAGRKRVS